MVITSIRRTAGFALLNILLGTILLVGVILLIMQTMSHFHAEQKYRTLGEEFSPIVSALIEEIVEGEYSTALPVYDNLVAYHDISEGYLQSLQKSGFDMHDASVEIAYVPS